MVVSNCPICGNHLRYDADYYDELTFECPSCGAKGNEGFDRKFTAFYVVFDKNRKLVAGQMDGESGKCPLCGDDIEYYDNPGEIDDGFRFRCPKCFCQGVEGFVDVPNHQFTNVTK